VSKEELIKNGHVRWPALIFISISIVGIVATLTLWGAGQVIANDRIRASEDVRVIATFNARFEKLLELNQMEHKQMMGDLREMKSKMGIPNNPLRI